jgi:hypothetical protein
VEEKLDQFVSHYKLASRYRRTRSLDQDRSIADIYAVHHRASMATGD